VTIVAFCLLSMLPGSAVFAADLAKKDILMELLSMTTGSESRLIIIGISNSTNFLERALLPECSTRLNSTCFTFPAYGWESLAELLRERQDILPGPVFAPKAVEFIAKRVSNWTGDARQLLDVAQQAIEQSQEEATEFKDSEDMAGPGRNTGAVAFRHAGKALSKIQTLCGAEGAKSMISSLTSGQLTVLCAAARLTVGWESGASHTKQMNRKRTRNNWTLKEIFDVYATLTKRAQVPSLSHPEFFVVCSILDDMACLRLGPRKNVEWLRKAQLKVTVADIAEVVQGNSFYQRMLGLTE